MWECCSYALPPHYTHLTSTSTIFSLAFCLCPKNCPQEKNVFSHFVLDARNKHFYFVRKYASLLQLLANMKYWKPDTNPSVCDENEKQTTKQHSQNEINLTGLVRRSSVPFHHSHCILTRQLKNNK